MVAVVQKFPVNVRGRDLLVGDIHGCFHVLEDALKKIRFNPEVDRVFSCGDLVNRGPYSAQVLKWLQQPWFHAVRGNHEIMALMALSGDFSYGQHLGRWITQLSTSDARAITQAFNQLPLVLEVALPSGRFGVLHGDILHTDWNMFTADLQQDGFLSKLAERTVWSRHRYKYDIRIPVLGVNVVYVGHTVVDDVDVRGNVAYLDTGCCYGKKLTIADAHSGKTYHHAMY